MDQTDTLTARAVVNEWPQEELRRILWQYGRSGTPPPSREPSSGQGQAPH